MTKTTANKKSNSPMSIAIVGIGGIFPGANNLDEFWQLIENAQSAATEVPDGRWPEKVGYYHQQSTVGPDKVLTKRGCYIKNIPSDFSGLNITEEQVKKLDPLFSITLQAGRDAFKDAKTDKLDKSRVPVIIANIALPTDTTSDITNELYSSILDAQSNGKTELSTRTAIKTDPRNRYSAELPGGLLARALGLGGGAETLDAACASSLYAIKLACEELRSGRADAVLTGGVSRPSSQFTQMGFSQLTAITKSGVCRPFSKGADGLMVGEGAGMFILKRLDDALEADDKIYGVIRGIGLANDVGGSLLAPDSEGQLRAMLKAYDQADWNPSEVQLVECHGTGTPKGDGIEFESLRRLWENAENAKDKSCVIGSVKSNVGHLLTGAGAAGLMKLIFALQNKKLPPVANLIEPDPAMKMHETAFKVISKAEEWKAPGKNKPRKCALSAFGFGGIDGHVLIEEWLPENKKSVKPSIKDDSNNVDVAIVGIGTKVGSLQTLQDFQTAVFNGKAAVTDLPENRHPMKTDAKWMKKGAYLSDLKIPLGKFKISPKELPEILPQQLLMLQAVDDALEKQIGERSDSKNWGVFIGIGQDFEATNFASRWNLTKKPQTGKANELSLTALRDSMTPPLSNTRTVGSLGGIVASRVAREFKVGGPSHTFSSGENSGISALECGVRALQRGEINTSIVGAIDLAGDLRNLICVDIERPYTRKGDSVPFNAGADGSFPGEGAVAVVIKRLDDAIADGDRIYSVIKGLGKGTGGKVIQTSCDETGYQKALTDAYQDAGISAESISLLETHGSGIPAEDRIEARAISEFFPKKEISEENRFKTNDQLCALSSSKTVIGHTSCAAGLMSIAKTALCLYNEVLPGMPGLQNPIPELKSRDDFFFAPNQPQYWLRNKIQGPRTAGVSSMSIDGSCYHVVMQAFEDEEKLAPKAQEQMKLERTFPAGNLEEFIFTANADSPAGLINKLKSLKSEMANSTNFAKFAKQWWQNNKPNSSQKSVLTIVASTGKDLATRIDYAIKHLTQTPDKPIKVGPEVQDRIFYSPTPIGKSGKVCFMFPGSGNHFLGMGLKYGLNWPEFMHSLDREHDLLAAQFAPKVIAPWRLAWPKGWETDGMKNLIDDHNSLVFSHVSCCALLSDVVRNFGINPEIIMGYSLGETAGNFATRTWTKRDHMVQRMRKSELFTKELIGDYTSARQHWGLSDKDEVIWQLGLIEAPAAEVEKLLPKYPQAYVLIINTSKECVIGGNKKQVDALVKEIGATYFPIDGVSSVHCEAAIPVSEAYRELHVYDCTPPKGMTFISSGKGETFVPEKKISADSIKAQCIGTIDFPKCVETAYKEGARIFLEIGPRQSMSRMVDQILGDRPHFARSALLYGQNEISTLTRFLANLIAEHIDVDLAPIYENRHMTFAEAKKTRPEIEVKVGSKIKFEFPTKKAEAPKVVSQPATLKAKPIMTNKPAPQLTPNPAPAPAPQPAPVAQPAQIQAQSYAAPTPVPAPAPAQPQTAAMPVQNTVIGEWMKAQDATAKAHEAFLQFSHQLTMTQAQILQGQLSAGMSPAEMQAAISQPIQYSAPMPQAQAAPQTPAMQQAPVPAFANKMPKPYTGEVFMDREKSMEYAIGSIEKALGSYFKEVDSYPTRVRLPDIPLNFVDRMILVEGEKGSLGKGRCVTQHDVYPDAWYSDNYCMPTGMAVEAGQADLFLSGWLGIDFKTKGLAKYRLLDAVVTFHGPLPRPGDTINYDIRVDRFIRQADTYLFFFEFDGTVDGKKLITMRKGCAGFFTDKQLADGRGIVLTEEDTRIEPKPKLVGRENLPPMVIESYDDQRLDKLRAGDLAGAFGPEFAGINFRPQTIPDGMMKMIDRITEINPEGGRFGLGQIKCEIDIPKDPWFLTQHFSDDQVMPGTLMYESCMQSLRVFLLRMGWVADANLSAFEPVLEVQSQLICRGQVIPGVKKALYEITIKEIGYNPEPYAIADALMFADGNRIVQVLNMSIRLSGSSREQIEGLWSNLRGQQPVLAHTPTLAPQPQVAVDPEILPAIYTGQQIYEYAIGKPSICFGEKFKVFDDGRYLARLPNPPYLFVDRISHVDAEFLKIKAGGHVHGQFDVDPNGWYFRANRQTSMPFSVFLEFPLQVCGWYSCYMGSCFESEDDLQYRNLDGSATLYEDITTDIGTLTAEITSTKAANAGGMLIQSFNFQVKRQGRVVYDGETTFGFFSRDALANQVGLRGAKPYEPSAAEISRSIPYQLPMVAPMTPEDTNVDQMNGLVLPGKALMMVDEITLFIPDGGPQGKGFIRGIKKVDPSEWFFKAHFYMDPVIPGSLGLESFIQLMKAYAINRWGDQLKGRACHFETIALGKKHKWSYRGQVIPKDNLVTVDASITNVDDQDYCITADGLLQVDGRNIYEMKDFAIRVVFD